ncbi:MAG: PilZ domain-containing protein [Syntrophobacteria bacterium]
MYRVGPQKRRLYRAEVTWAVTVETAKGSVEAETRDISTEGAHIRLSTPLELHEPVNLIIRPTEREPLKVAATVIWSEGADQSGRPRIIGARFTEISNEDRQFLEQVAARRFRDKMKMS